MTDAPLSIAVVGLGRISRSHIDGIQHWPDRCTLGAVVDIQESRAVGFADEYGVPYYTSTAEAFADPGIDAVVVCVPHHLHAEVAIEACEAGNHVLVEKVMATSPEEGVAMVEAAEENGVNLMVGQSRRFFPKLREAWRRRDEIGRPIHLLYTFACFFDVEAAPAWWQEEEKTGGLVYPMLGAHSIDYTLWMFDDRRPVSVYAEGAVHNDAFEGDDEASIIITFDDGSHATNFLTINNRPAKHQGLVVGSNGSVYFDQTGDHAGDLVGTADTSLTLNGTPVEVGGDVPHNFAVQMKEFTDSIIEDRAPRPAGADIIPQLRVIDAARRSSVAGTPIQIDEPFDP